MKFSTKHIPLLFLIGRFVLLLSLPLEGLTGYGDLSAFFSWASLEGWPYLDYWMEFPPLFPFIGETLFRLSGEQIHVFQYALAILFTFAQAGSLSLLIKIAGRILGETAAVRLGFVYFGLIIGLFYGWTYFDPLAVFAMLLGVYWLLCGKDMPAAFALGAGALIKFFPILAVPLIWKVRPVKRAAVLSAISIGMVVAAYGALYLISPEYTAASLRSQGSKGSWESVWALVDSNFGTGNFGPFEERYNPETAVIPRGNPPRISSFWTLLPIGLLGMWMLLTREVKSELDWIRLLGGTWTLFLVWSPGWSPQWVLYLIPLILLGLKERTAFLLALVLLLVNLVEWPLLLSRGSFDGLWLTIPLRTFLLIILAFEYWGSFPLTTKGLSIGPSA